MPPSSPSKAARGAQRYLRHALRIREYLRLGDRQSIFLWAALVRVIGEFTALLFELCVELVQDVLTGTHDVPQLQAFTELAKENPYLCAIVPGIGGLLAALTLLFTHRFVPATAPEYMEAVALGNGYVPSKPSFLDRTRAV